MKFARTQNGFTLVEMVVAIAIFIVVALVAIGALLKIVDANKKAQSIKSAITNLNFSLESMTRELRVGSTYNCTTGQSAPTVLSSPATTPDCSTTGLTGSWTIAFNSSETADNGAGGLCNLVHAYWFNGTSLFKGEQSECNGTYSFYPLIYGYTSSSDTELNDAAITFTRGRVKVVTANGNQPYVQFHFMGSAGAKERLKSYFNLQTTVSQRIID